MIGKAHKYVTGKQHTVPCHVSEVVAELYCK